MAYAIPTNKSELYQTLNQIFNFYRIKRPNYEGIILEPIKLARQEFTPLTDAELIEKARLLLRYEQTKISEAKKTELQKEQTILNGQIQGENEKLSTLSTQIESEYQSLELSLEQDAKKKGLSNSTIFISKLAELESEKANKIATLNAEVNEKVTELQNRLHNVNVTLSNLDSYFQTMFDSQITSKVRELKSEQEELVRDIFRYNNGLDEKEQRNENAIKQAQASLELKYNEITSNDLSHDKLVDMGYYNEVMDCICGYYDSAFSSPVLAYQDMLDEHKLAIYLDEYYSEMLYLYKMKAGL